MKMHEIPEDIWEQIMRLLGEDCYLESLSLVSRSFLRITNRLKQTLVISDATSEFLPKLFHRFPNLNHISLSDYHGEPASVLEQISLSNFNFPLLSLDLSNHRAFPSKSIQQLPTSSLISLKALHLRNLPPLNDSDLRVISQFMPNLEELDVSDPKEDSDSDSLVGITDDGVDSLASNLPRLRLVNLSGHYFISDKSLVTLAQKCPFLEHILVKNCTFVTHVGLAFAFQFCCHLKSVALLGMDLPVLDISPSLPSARFLSVLDFSYISLSDALLFAIAKASLPLLKFSLFHCKDFTFSGVLSFLRSYSSLDYFAVEGVYWITDRTIIDLSKFLRKATTLKFNFCSRVTTSGLFTILKNCPSLNLLELEKTDLGKEEFAVNNAYNSKLRALVLCSSKSLSNECLEKIAYSCPGLELLDVSDCPNITRKGIGEIVRNCVFLSHIQMSGCGAIKSLGIDAKLRKLKFLRASGSGLNDDALIVIAKRCPALMNLDISGCSGVSSKGVKEVVYHCGRLKEINLKWCREMGRDIVAWMVFSRPSLRKIVPPRGFGSTEYEKCLFLRHGCLLCEG